MNFAAQGHYTIGVFVPHPTGPAEAAGICFSDSQFSYFLLAQDQANVIFEGGTKGETHQRAQRLITDADGQEFVETVPVQFADMDPELAGATPNLLSPDQLFATHEIGRAALRARGGEDG